RGYPGTLANVNPHFRTIACPFTGEALLAVRALRPDVAVVHAQMADREGNVLVRGIIGVQKGAVLAAKRSLVTVEEIVDDVRAIADTNACVLPHWTVDAIALAPGGAFPSYAYGYYARDNAFYRGWDDISRDRERFLAWLNEHVMP